jgi:hypothetical protein
MIELDLLWYYIDLGRIPIYNLALVYHSNILL